MEKLNRGRSNSQLKKVVLPVKKRQKSKGNTPGNAQESIIKMQKILKKFSKIRKRSPRTKRKQASSMPSSSYVSDAGNQDTRQKSTKRRRVKKNVSNEDICTIPLAENSRPYANSQIYASAVNSSTIPTMKDNSFNDTQANLKSFIRKVVKRHDSSSRQKSISSQDIMNSNVNSLKIFIDEDISGIHKQKLKKKVKVQAVEVQSQRKRKSPKRSSKNAKGIHHVTLKQSDETLNALQYSQRDINNAASNQHPNTNKSHSSTGLKTVISPLTTKSIKTPLDLANMLVPRPRVSDFAANIANSPSRKKIPIPRLKNFEKAQKTERTEKKLETANKEGEVRNKSSKLRERVEINRKGIQKRTLSDLSELQKFREIESNAAKIIQKAIKAFIKRKQFESKTTDVKKEEKKIVNTSLMQKSSVPSNIQGKQTQRKPAKVEIENSKKLENLLRIKLQLNKKRKSQRKITPQKVTPQSEAIKIKDEEKVETPAKTSRSKAQTARKIANIDAIKDSPQKQSNEQNNKDNKEEEKAEQKAEQKVEETKSSESNSSEKSLESESNILMKNIYTNTSKSPTKRSHKDKEKESKVEINNEAEEKFGEGLLKITLHKVKDHEDTFTSSMSSAMKSRDSDMSNSIERGTEDKIEQEQILNRNNKVIRPSTFNPDKEKIEAELVKEIDNKPKEISPIVDKNKRRYTVQLNPENIRKLARQSTVNESEITQENRSFKNTLETGSKDSESIASDYIPIKAVGYTKGEPIQWSLQLAENNPDHANAVTVELLAYKPSKQDIVAFKKISFDMLENIDSKSLGLSKWIHVAVLMSDCLSIFESLCKSAPDYNLHALIEKSIEASKTGETDSRFISLIDEFIENNHVMASSFTLTNIGSILKTLQDFQANYPNSNEQQQILEGISVHATSRIADYLQAHNSKDVVLGTIVNMFAKEMIDYCYRDITHLFTLIKEINGKKLKMIKQFSGEMTMLQRSELVRIYLTTHDPIIGNPQSANTKQIKLNDGAMHLNMDSIKGGKSINEERDITIDNEGMDLSSSEVRKSGVDEITLSNDVSMEESQDYKKLLEPMQTTDKDIAKQEKVNKPKENRNNEIELREQEDMRKISEILTNFQQCTLPFYRDNSDILEQGAITLFKEHLVVAISIVEGPVIECVNELNDMNLALSKPSIEIGKLDESESESAIETSPKFGNSKKAQEYMHKMNNKYTPPLEPKDVFQLSTVDQFLGNCCVKMCFLYRQAKKKQTLFLSFNELINLMRHFDEEFELQEFIRFGCFSEKSRVAFYDGLKKRAYMLYNRIYILMDNNVNSKDSNRATAKDTGQGFNGANFVSPRSKDKSFFKMLKSIWSTEEEAKGQVIIRKEHSSWENTDYQELIRNKLLKYNMHDDRKENQWILGESAKLSKNRYFVSFQLSYCDNNRPYLVLSMSTPFRTFEGQQIFIIEQSQLNYILDALETRGTRQWKKFMDIVLPQNMIEEKSILGTKYKMRKMQNNNNNNRGIKQGVLSRISQMKRYLLMDQIPESNHSIYRQIINSPDLGPCMLCVIQIITERPIQESKQEKGMELEWTISLENELKLYQVNTNRIWKIIVFQKDTIKHYELMLTDFDFKEIYLFFSKSEKVFYDLFRPELMLKKEEILVCLKILGRKLLFQKTDIGSVLVLDALRKPNLRVQNKDFYVPIREFIRQQTIMNEVLVRNSSALQLQYCTNVRYTVLQTTTKHSSGKYLNITVYYMIPLNSWKIKIRVASTGRCFIADVSEAIFAKFNEKQAEKMKDSKVVRRARNSEILGQSNQIETKIKEIEIKTEGIIKSVPREMAIRETRKNRNYINPEYINNLAMREIQNLASETEIQKKQRMRVTAWASMISTLTYIKTSDKRNAIAVEDDEPIILREILCDGMEYSNEDKCFIYTEVELNAPTNTKGMSKLAMNTPIQVDFTCEMPGLQKSRWSEYTLKLSTYHLTSMSRFSPEIRLSNLISSEEKGDTSSATTLSYDQLRMYAAKFSHEAIGRHSVAATMQSRKMSRKVSEIKEQLTEEPKEVEASSFGVIPKEANAFSPGNILKHSSVNLAQKVIEKDITYEEIIQISPPIIGKVIIYRSFSQIILKVTDLRKSINYEIPVLFQQASKHCLIPIPLLYKENPFISKRLLDGYKEIMLKQYYEVAACCK